MFKDGKIFGKVNIFDALIVLLILVLIIVGTTKFRTFSQTVDTGSNGKVIYTFVINDVRNYTADAYKSGDSVFDSLTDVYIGKITDVSYRSARIVKPLASGKNVVAENPYKKDVILTIECPGSKTDIAYFANKSIELKIGNEKSIETLYATSFGKVGSIKYVEGE